MSFQFKPARRESDAPEINLVAFIDVLLVVLIFLMLTTTFSQLTQMQLTLPVANTEQLRSERREVAILIAADGRYKVNEQALAERHVDAVTAALTVAASAAGGRDALVIISADASAPHQSVITAMEAARRVGLVRITFAAQATPQ